MAEVELGAADDLRMAGLGDALGVPAAEDRNLQDGNDWR
jgi:hypothetical protein